MSEIPRPHISLGYSDIYPNFSLQYRQETIAGFRTAISYLNYLFSSKERFTMDTAVLEYPDVESLETLSFSTKSFMEAIPRWYGDGDLLLWTASLEGSVVSRTSRIRLCFFSTIGTDLIGDYVSLIADYWRRLTRDRGVYRTTGSIPYRKTEGFDLGYLSETSAAEEMVRELSFCIKDAISLPELHGKSLETVFVRTGSRRT